MAAEGLAAAVAAIVIGTLVVGRSRRWPIQVVIAGVALLALTVSLVSVGIAASSGSSFALSASSGLPGASTTVSGTGFGAKESVQVRFVAMLMSTVTTTSVGTFASTIKVPVGAAGINQITAVGSASHRTGSLSFLLAGPKSIQVTPSNASIGPGNTQQFTANGTYADATVHDVTAFATWSSSAPSVATVSNSSATKGLATGVSGGTTSIKAVMGTVMGAANLVVALPPPTITANSQSDESVAVNWSAVSGASGYEVRRSSDGGTSFASIASPSATSFQGPRYRAGKHLHLRGPDGLRRWAIWRFEPRPSDSADAPSVRLDRPRLRERQCDSQLAGSVGQRRVCGACIGGDHIGSYGRE